MSKSYVIGRAAQAPDLSKWDSPSWSKAGLLELKEFRPEGSDHRPRVQAKFLYDAKGIYGIYKVDDRYVRCVRTGFNQSVCRDSCVEFFFQPFGKGGYLNFEFNCGGAVLSQFIEDCTRLPKGGFTKFAPLSDADLRQVEISHSMPSTVDPEITEPTTWTLGFHIPFKVIETYRGEIDPARLPGQPWRANFYKCADETSHPHWISWNPVSALNFHLPDCFAEIVFAP